MVPFPAQRPEVGAPIHRNDLLLLLLPADSEMILTLILEITGVYSECF